MRQLVQLMIPFKSFLILSTFQRTCATNRAHLPTLGRRGGLAGAPQRPPRCAPRARPHRRQRPCLPLPYPHMHTSVCDRMHCTHWCPGIIQGRVPWRHAGQGRAGQGRNPPGPGTPGPAGRGPWRSPRQPPAQQAQQGAGQRRHVQAQADGPEGRGSRPSSAAATDGGGRTEPPGQSGTWGKWHLGSVQSCIKLHRAARTAWAARGCTGLHRLHGGGAPQSTSAGTR